MERFALFTKSELEETHRAVSLALRATNADEDDEETGSPRVVDDEPDDDEMSNDERRRRGVMAKRGPIMVSKRGSRESFANVVFGDDEPASTRPVRKAAEREPVRKALGEGVFRSAIIGDCRAFDLEQQPSRQPRGRDEDEDGLNREYGEAVLERLGRYNGRVESTWEGDTRQIAYRPTQFMPRGEGDLGRHGGEDDPRATEFDGAAYELLRENIEPSAIPVRLGNAYVMSPTASGLADAAPFVAPEPATSVRKSLGRGRFTNLVTGPLPADSNTGNFFSE
jgi:hypothetical protein